MTALFEYTAQETEARAVVAGPWSLAEWPSLVAAIVNDEWGVHDLCTLTACRTPLHPGPCKGWKHTLHATAPGVFHTLEKARVEKANAKRVAKIAQLKSEGKAIPKALLKPITYNTPGILPQHIGQKAEIATGGAHQASHDITKATGVVKDVAPPAHPVTVDTAGAPKAPEKLATSPGKTTLGEATKAAKVTPAAAQVAPEPKAAPEAKAPVADFVKGETRIAPEPSGTPGLFEVAKDRGHNGDGWFHNPDGSKGPWGKYGAAGAMFSHVDPSGTRRYLLVQRGPKLDHPGKWQLPGGAIDSKETPHQGATRETIEELGVKPSDLSDALTHGEHVSTTPGGWKYTSIAATVPDQFTPDISGHRAKETSDAKWLTKEEIDQLDHEGKLLAPLAAGKIHDNITSLFPTAPKTDPAIQKLAENKSLILTKRVKGLGVPADHHIPVDALGVKLGKIEGNVVHDDQGRVVGTVHTGGKYGQHDAKGVDGWLHVDGTDAAGKHELHAVWMGKPKAPEPVHAVSKGAEPSHVATKAAEPAPNKDVAHGIGWTAADFLKLPADKQNAVIKDLTDVLKATDVSSKEHQVAEALHARYVGALHTLPSPTAHKATPKVEAKTPALPHPNASASVKHATAVANGTAPGAKLAKVQLAAYLQLSKTDFKALPEGTQKKILADLTVAHGKFLDPKKKAEAGYVHEMLSGEKIGKAGAPKAEAHPVNAVAHELERAKALGAKGYNDNQLQAIKAAHNQPAPATALSAIMKITHDDFGKMSYDDRMTIKAKLAQLTGVKGPVGEHALIAHKLLTGTLKPVDTGPNEHGHNLGEQVAAHLGVQVGQSKGTSAHLDAFQVAVTHGGPTEVAAKIKNITPSQFESLPPSMKTKAIAELEKLQTQGGDSGAIVMHGLAKGLIVADHGDGKEHTFGESLAALGNGTAKAVLPGNERLGRVPTTPLSHTQELVKAKAAADYAKQYKGGEEFTDGKAMGAAANALTPEAVAGLHPDDQQHLHEGLTKAAAELEASGLPATANAVRDQRDKLFPGGEPKPDVLQHLLDNVGKGAPSLTPAELADLAAGHAANGIYGASKLKPADQAKLEQALQDLTPAQYGGLTPAQKSIVMSAYTKMMTDHGPGPAVEKLARAVSLIHGTPYTPPAKPVDMHALAPGASKDSAVSGSTVAKYAEAFLAGKHDNVSAPAFKHEALNAHLESLSRDELEKLPPEYQQKIGEALNQSHEYATNAGQSGLQSKLAANAKRLGIQVKEHPTKIDPTLPANLKQAATFAKNHNAGNIDPSIDDMAPILAVQVYSKINSHEFDLLPAVHQKSILDSIAKFTPANTSTTDLKALADAKDKMLGISTLSPTPEKLGGAAAKATSKAAAKTGGKVDLAAPAKVDILGAFKMQPTGSQLKDPTQDAYDNVLAITHAFTGKPGFGDLSLEQVLKAIDEQHAKNLGVPNAGLLEQKVTSWLATPEGAAYAASATPKTSIVSGLKKDDPTFPPGAKPRPDGKTIKLSGPGGYSAKLTSKDFVARSPEAAQAEHDVAVAKSGKPWTPDQQQALKTYTSASGSMNNYLREDGAHVDPLTRQRVIDAQAGMRPLTSNHLLTRGTGWEQLPPEYRSVTEVAKLIGKTIEDPGFLSTSVGGGGFGGFVRLEIEAPIGTQAAFVKSISHFPHENEMLLAAGTKMKVLSVSQDGGQTVLRVRVVTPKK